MPRVHIWADIRGDWRPSSQRDATAHARPGDLVDGVDSLRDLRAVFRQYQRNRTRIESLDFHTHGCGGSLSLGAEHLDPDTLQSFRNQQFETLFAPNARFQLTTNARSAWAGGWSAFRSILRRTRCGSTGIGWDLRRTRCCYSARGC